MTDWFVAARVKAAIGVALARLALLAGLALAGAAVPQGALAAEMVTGLGGTSGYGTLALGRNDDGSSGVIALGASFPSGIKLFTGTYSTLYVNNNGNLTFQAPYGTYTPIPFPITNLPMLAAFWGDVDTRGGSTNPADNNVYYSTASPGKFIVTWNKVGYYSAAINKLNSFQIVLTDRSEIAQGDFDIEYRYNQLEWTTGGASGGSNGLGGTPAQMGYDAGDGKNFYRHADSGTAAILNLTQTSNTGEPGVWRFEVRGGTPNPVKIPQLVNVRLIQTLNAADIALDQASFTTPPARVASANGQTTIEWAFAAFPANISKDLSYDVIFKNPLAGERRELVSKLELLYNDVNGNPVRTELGAEFINVYPSIYQVAPASDKPRYGANEAVLINSMVRNLSAFPGTTAVRLSVLDASGALVAALGSSPLQTVGANASLMFGGAQFSTGTTYPGTYRLLAELLDAGGAVQATGTGSFVIAAATTGQAQVSITTDQQVYNPFDTVRVFDRVTNQLVNASLDALRVVTSITNPDGTVRISKTETLAQLPPGGVREYPYSVPLGWAAMGDYNASVTLFGADGSVLAQAQTRFTVASSAQTGAGLDGVISAAPAVVNSGSTVALRFSATNNGNAALEQLPLTVSIIDAEQEIILASHAYVASLAVGGQYPGSTEWIAQSSPSGNYVAVLSATVGGQTRVLAQVPLTVLMLDIGQRRKPGNRVLALVSCKDGEAAAPTSGNPCLTERSVTIARALATAGVSYTIATDPAVFQSALRSGLYNTYWLSGKQDKLHGNLASEVREAVYGGDGALIDSEHDQRNGTLDAMAGVRWQGKFGQTNLAVDVGGPVFAATTIGSIGRSDRLELAGGVQQAAFNLDRPQDGGSAIITNLSGAGRVVQYAFDLPTSLRSNAPWQAVLETSLLHVQPPVTDPVNPGTLVPVGISIQNLGAATGIGVTSTLPAGAAYLASLPQGAHDAVLGTLTWRAELPAGQTWNGALSLRAPAGTGTYALSTVVNTVDAVTGVASPYGVPTVLQINVVGAAQNAAAAMASLRSLAPLSAQDSRLRDKLLADIDQAMLGMQQQSAAGYDAAIGQLLGVIDQLDGLSGVNTRPAHESLNRMVREAQWRWSQATSKTTTTGN